MKTNDLIRIAASWFLLLAIVAVTGCERRRLSPEPVPEPVEEPIPGAPQIDNACRFVITTPISAIKSVAFSESGVYYVAYKKAGVVAGSYSYDDGVYTMDGFGTLSLFRTKAQSFSEQEATITIKDENGKETLFSSTIQKNPNNRNPLFRSWKIDKVYLSVEGWTDATLYGLEFDKLRWALASRGVQTDDIPAGVELKSVDICGTGEFSAAFKLPDTAGLQYSVVGTWAEPDTGMNVILLDWKASNMKFMERDKNAEPAELGYSFDWKTTTLSVSFSLKGKDNKDQDVGIDCAMYFSPNLAVKN